MAYIAGRLSRFETRRAHSPLVASLMKSSTTWHIDWGANAWCFGSAEPQTRQKQQHDPSPSAHFGKAKAYQANYVLCCVCVLDAQGGR